MIIAALAIALAALLIAMFVLAYAIAHEKRHHEIAGLKPISFEEIRQRQLARDREKDR